MRCSDRGCWCRRTRSREACRSTNILVIASSPACKTGCLVPSSPSFIVGIESTRYRPLRRFPSSAIRTSFHFDTEIIIQLVIAGKRIKEIPIPTYYGDEICRVKGLEYGFNVLKASLQAWFQKINLFYDRRFDCAPPQDGLRYPSKLDFESTHSRVIELVPVGARVLDIGSGTGAVGAALKKVKGGSGIRLRYRARRSYWNFRQLLLGGPQ